MSKTEAHAPINKVVEEVKAWEDSQSLVSRLNREAERCRTIHSPTLREGCYVENVIPLMVRIQELGYSLEFSIATGEYSPIYVGGEGAWEHPTVKRH